MGVKTPVLTDKRGLTKTFTWLRFENPCRAVKTGVLTSMRFAPGHCLPTSCSYLTSPIHSVPTESVFSQKGVARRTVRGAAASAGVPSLR